MNKWTQQSENNNIKSKRKIHYHNQHNTKSNKKLKNSLTDLPYKSKRKSPNQQKMLVNIFKQHLINLIKVKMIIQINDILKNLFQGS